MSQQVWMDGNGRQPPPPGGGGGNDSMMMDVEQQPYQSDGSCNSLLLPGQFDVDAYFFSPEDRTSPAAGATAVMTQQQDGGQSQGK